MKKKNLKLLKLNKKSISNFAIYGGGPEPRDTKYEACTWWKPETHEDTCVFPTEEEEETYARATCEITVC